MSSVVDSRGLGIVPWASSSSDGLLCLNNTMYFFCQANLLFLKTKASFCCFHERVCKVLTSLSSLTNFSWTTLSVTDETHTLQDSTIRTKHALLLLCGMRRTEYHMQTGMTVFSPSLLSRSSSPRHIHGFLIGEPGN